MKNKHLLMVALSTVFFFSCKKNEIITPTTEQPITISALVPLKVYTNRVRDISLDASSTATNSGKRALFFQWSCPTFPAGYPPLILSPSKADTKLDSLHGGLYVFRLKVWDTTGSQAFAEYQVEVIQDSLQGSPKIIPIPDIVLQLPKYNVELNGTGNYSVNPTGRRLNFTWSVLESPANSIPVVFTQNGSADVIIRFVTPGQYQFALTLTNELGLSSIDSIKVIVLADPLSGTEKMYDNLDWTLHHDPYGYYADVTINEKATYSYRDQSNMTVSLWDEENQVWISTEKFNVIADFFGLTIETYDNPARFAGKKTKLKVKFL